MLYGFVYIQYIYREIDNPDLGFPGALNSKEFACNAGDLSSIPGLGRSPEREHGNTLQYSCLENSYRQRSLAVYSPRGHKELATTEQLSIHTYSPDSTI